jgi:hypothetical protein
MDKSWVKTDGSDLASSDCAEVVTYVTALYKGPLPVWPGAYLIVTGRKDCLEFAKQKLTDRWVPLQKIPHALVGMLMTWSILAVPAESYYGLGSRDHSQLHGFRFVVLRMSGSGITWTQWRLQ